MAGWQSGYAADCKSVYTSSILVSASILYYARVVELVDTRDLKSLAEKRAGSSPAPGTIFQR